MHMRGRSVDIGNAGPMCQMELWVTPFIPPCITCSFMWYMGLAVTDN